MMQRSRLHTLTLIVIALCTLAGCDSSRRAGKKQWLAVETADLFTARLQLSANNNKSKGASIQGIFTFRRDSLIRISLLAPVVRTEGVRIEIYKEGYLIIDRANKLYATGSHTDLIDLWGININFARVQETLTTTMFAPSTATQPPTWMLNTGKVELTPSHMKDGQRSSLLMEISRAGLPGRMPTATVVSAKYTRVSLQQIVQALEDY